MKTIFGSYLLLPVLVPVLALALACTDTSSPGTIPVALPTESPPQSVKPSSASDLEAVDEFASRQQAVGQEWDRFHQEFDQWRAGLTSCHGSSVRKALQDFAVGFNAVTEQARDLPRASVTRKLADMLIAAAEEEEAAFRSLRDRWQPNSPSLFETLEEQRSNAARAQKEVEDLANELQEELGRAADPRELQAMEAFSAAFDLIRGDWEQFHDDYADLLREAEGLDGAAILARLEQLIQQFGAISKAINRLPAADAVGETAETLEETAEAELTALTNLYDTLTQAVAEANSAGEESDTQEQSDGEGQSDNQGQNGTQRQSGAEPAEGSGREVGPFLVAMNTAIVAAETTLKEISRDIHEELDRTAVADLEDVRAFIGDYKRLLKEWDAFHEGYNEWRRTEGGCDRSEVLQSLAQFNTRIGELGRRVRDLPQSGYLLPMYNLLVEAAEREQGAVRALRNSWQPFSVDAFIAVDRERDNANRLRREANIALQELRNRP